MQNVGAYATVLRNRGVDAPLSVNVTLVGARGARIYAERERASQKDHCIDRDLLLLPDVLVEEMPVDWTGPLRPIFDALWQASGFERSGG